MSATDDDLENKIEDILGHSMTVQQAEISSASQDVCRVMAYVGPVVAAAQRGYLLTENPDEFLLLDMAQNVMNRVMDRMRVAAEAYYAAPDFVAAAEPDVEMCPAQLEGVEAHELGTVRSCAVCVAHRFAD
jgi:hypothetical protein